jgi:putative NADH-flavin reductase
MNLVIVGASRGIGLETVKAALAAGHRVHAVARHEGDEIHPQLAWYVADAVDAQTYDDALVGAHAVIMTLGLGAKLTREPVTLFSDATRALIAAMMRTEVRRLVCVTGIGTGDSRGHGTFFHDQILLRFGLKTIYADKDQQEQMLWGSGLDWTIIRPGFLTDGKATGRFRVLTKLEGVRAKKISRADVGDFLVKIVSDEKSNRQTLLVDGG